jgi:Ni/Fe-hydrogenase 1 B-type cytochrome subunit
MSDIARYSWSEAHSPQPKSPPVRVYVWELPVRVSHWLIFLPIVVLSFTGYYMHNPFIVGTSRTTFLMATVRFLHVSAGFVFIGAFLFRVYWFFAGNNWSSWRAFVPIRRRQWRGMGRMVAYYSFVRQDLAHHVGHNALAGITYLLMFTLMLVEILTGLALYLQVRGGWFLAAVIGWLPRLIDIQNIRLIHFCIMFAFFAFVIHHVYSAVLVSWEERNGLIESIFTGYKFVPADELEQEARAGKDKVHKD